MLFLAFVYLAVGQAAATRNEGQTAADAAALAAAQDAREQLRDGWLNVVLDPDEWGGYLRGEEYFSDRACQQAAAFAAMNSAELVDDGCTPLRAAFRVRIRTLDSVGESIVPGTERQHAVATATAVLEPRCFYDAPAQTVPPTTPTPTESTTPEPTSTPSPDAEPITGLVCGGVEWTIDPEDPRLPDAADLFTVRLTD